MEYLKIKDKVSLSKLKFHGLYDIWRTNTPMWVDTMPRPNITILVKDKSIQVHSDKGLCICYDLIQAGLVEKVVE